MTLADITFFLSSRRRHTRLVSDWSSDVCSSDLIEDAPPFRPDRRAHAILALIEVVAGLVTRHHVHFVLEVALADDDARDLAAQDLDAPLERFEAPDRAVRTVEDAGEAERQELVDELDDDSAEEIRALRPALEDAHRSVAVDDETGDALRVAADEPASAVLGEVARPCAS